MEEKPRFISLGREMVLTPDTEKSFTLSPGTDGGDGVTPAIEMLSFVSSPDEISVNGTPISGTHTSGALKPITPAHGALVHATTGNDAPADEDFSVNSIALQRPSAKNLLDRQNRLTAELLTRFTNLVKLATEPEGNGATLETQASLSLQMEVETTALVKAIEDLHRLTRDLKELWLAGPLRGIGEGEGDGKMADNSAEVQKLVDGITKKVRELNGRKNSQSK